MTFSSEEELRYNRHFAVNKVGVAGQHKLKKTAVLCIGAGGIGSPALLYLAAAGIGTLGIIDNDTVSLSNLQRQVLFSTEEQGQLKTACAANRLTALNPEITINTHPSRLNLDNAESLISAYDIILDGTDNYASRYLINDVCHTLKKPLVAASIFQFSGQLSLFNVPNGPCYRCLYPESPTPSLSPNCSEAGVLGVTPGILGTLAALEVIKVRLQLGDTLAGKLAIFDGLKQSLKHYAFSVSKDCPLCSGKAHYRDLHPQNLITTLSQTELPPFIEQEKQQLLLIDVRTEAEHQHFHLPGSQCLPLDQLTQQANSLPKDKKLLLYCAKGTRSQQAAEWLQNQGYQQLYVLEGGLVCEPN